MALGPSCSPIHDLAAVLSTTELPLSDRADQEFPDLLLLATGRVEPHRCAAHTHVNRFCGPFGFGRSFPRAQRVRSGFVDPSGVYADIETAKLDKILFEARALEDGRCPRWQRHAS